MKLFNAPAEIKIEEMDEYTAEKFANEVIPTVNYGDSNQKNKTKIRNDHFISKVGEIAVSKVFLSMNCEVEGPDFKIYRGRKKSWDADLKIDGEDLAVKTQSSYAAKKYGLSWTFQCGSPRIDPLLSSLDSWVCFVKYEERNNKCIVFPPKQIKDLNGKFKHPKLSYLKGKKVVIYAENIFGEFV